MCKYFVSLHYIYKCIWIRVRTYIYMLSINMYYHKPIYYVFLNKAFGYKADTNIHNNEIYMLQLILM